MTKVFITTNFKKMKVKIEELTNISFYFLQIWVKVGELFLFVLDKKKKFYEKDYNKGEGVLHKDRISEKAKQRPNVG